MKLVRWFLLFCLPFGVLLSFTPEVGAQSGACVGIVSCFIDASNACVPTPPPGAYDCDFYQGIGHCKVNTNLCPPPKATPENPRCIECEKRAATGGRPINLANGNVYIDQVDVSVPGLGGGLKLVRSWNSLWPPSQSFYRTAGMFGPNWRSNFEERIFVGDDSYIKYARGDGNFWSFGYAGSNWLAAAPANASAVLTQTSTNWVLTFKSGEKRLFDLASGWLTAIVDRNGNTTSLSYDGMNRLTTVTDPASRHLTFTYASSSSYQVIGVSSDVGLSLSYSYDGNGVLSQVTKPDQSKWVFEYDNHPYWWPNTPNPFIIAVKDESGKVLESHTYDCYGRGLSSSRANGVEFLSVLYDEHNFTGTCVQGLGTVSR